MRRKLLTILLAFSPAISRGIVPITVTALRELGIMPCDTGTPVSELELKSGDEGEAVRGDGGSGVKVDLGEVGKDEEKEWAGERGEGGEGEGLVGEVCQGCEGKAGCR